VIYSDVCKTPWGDIAVLWTGSAAAPVVTAAGFTSVGSLYRRWLATAKRDPKFAQMLASASKPVKKSSPKIRSAINQWVKGNYQALRAIKVKQPGPEFRQEVWTTLRKIKPGDSHSYQEVARLAGRPKAVRAAASACSNNLVAPFVPCHRVTRSGGDIGKYAYGLKIKKELLAHEGAPVA